MNFFIGITDQDWFDATRIRALQILDPLMELAMPGFIVGVIFSTVLWFAEGGRRFDELSLLRIAAWGTVVGLLMGVLALALGTPSDGFPLWLVLVIIVAPSTLLSTISAVGSALLFRYAARHKIPVYAGPKR